MKGIVEVAESVGELKIPKGIIIPKADGVKPSSIVIIATGSQGEDMSALYKMSKDESTVVDVSENDVIVFSSSPIPGNERNIFEVINNLYRQGCDVIYDSLNDVHVSGHAYEDELKRMLTLVKPKYFMPIHGEYRHQAKHAQLANSVGIRSKNIIIPNIGEIWSINKNRIHLARKCESGKVYVDEDIIKEGEKVIQERRTLAKNGMVLVLGSVDTKRCVLDGPAEIIGKGIYISEELEEKLVDIIALTIATQRVVNDLNEVAYQVKKAVTKAFRKEHQDPIVLPILINA